MSQLQKLPSELLLAIANEDTLRLKDVSALSRCTKTFYSALNRLLYRRDAKSPTRWALLWSCITGNVEAARLSIDAGSNVNEQYDYRLVEWHTGQAMRGKSSGHLSLCQSALNVAAMHEREDVIRVLLEHGAKLNTEYGVATAIRNGLDDLFRMYVPLLVGDQNGMEMTEAFELAVKYKRKQMLEALCAVTRQDDLREDHDFFALLRAVSTGSSFEWFKEIYDMGLLASQDREMVAELWSECARANNETGDKAFDFLLQDRPWLSTYYHEDIPRVWQEIISRGNVRAARKLWPYIDTTILLEEPEELLEAAIASKNCELVQFVLEKCSEHDESINLLLPSFLLCACESGSVEIIKFLQARGGDLKATYQGLTGVHYALNDADPDVMAYLLEDGFVLPSEALKNLWAHGRFDPIPEAEKGPSPEYVKLLLENGANPNAAAADGTLPLHRLFVYYAFGNGEANQGFDIFLELLKLLVSHGANIDVVMNEVDAPRYFCEAGAPFVQYLLDQSAFDDISPMGLYDWFRAAYDWQDAKVVELLLPRVLACIKAGKFPAFHFMKESVAESHHTSYKVRTGRYEVLKLLLAHEEFRGHRAEFFLMNLCTANWPDVKSMRFLLENGVDLHCRNIEGVNETPLHTACHYNHPTLIQVLLEAGADANDLDALGRMPFDYIETNRYSDAPLDPSAMAQLLLMRGAKTGKLKLVGSMAEKVDQVRELWQKTMAGEDVEDGDLLDELQALQNLGALGHTLEAMGMLGHFDSDGATEDDSDQLFDEDDEVEEDDEDEDEDHSQGLL